MIPSAALYLAIDHLYEVFRPHPYRPLLPAHCDCCEVLDLSSLAVMPLRELTATDLTDVFFVVPAHSGNGADFRHYLPRILELMALDPNANLPPGVLTEQLGHAQVKSWPPSEREALRQYLHLLPEAAPLSGEAGTLLALLGDARSISA